MMNFFQQRWWWLKWGENQTHQHFHNLGVSSLGSPVKWWKLVVVPEHETCYSLNYILLFWWHWMLLIVHADEHFYLRMLIQHDFGDSSDEDDGGSVCILGWKKKTALGTGEGKDLCIIKQAPKDAALLACLSCAIRTLLVIVRLVVILTIFSVVFLAWLTFLSDSLCTHWHKCFRATTILGHLVKVKWDCFEQTMFSALIVFFLFVWWCVLQVLYASPNVVLQVL